MLKKYCLFIALLLASNVYAQERTISVRGSANIVVTPDLFRFSVYVEEKGELVSKLNAGVSEKTQQVIRLLKKHKVANGDIQSMHVQLNPWYERHQNGSRQKGFILSRQINITLRTLGDYSKLLDGVLKVGVTRIDGFSYELDDKSQVYMQALQQATENAKTRAQTLVKPLNVNVGAVRSIQEVNSHAPTPVYAKSMMAERMDMDLPGEIGIRSDVEVVFYLEDKPKSGG